jgi:multiple sugar transport system substrate-binding protein
MRSDVRLTRRDLLRMGAFVAAGAALASCAPATATTAAQPTGVAEVVTPAVAPLASGALDIWTFPMTEDDQRLIWDPLSERFHSEYPDVKTTIELLPWGGRREKMLAAYAAGQAPDVAATDIDTIQLFGRSDCMEPLDDILSPEVWADIPSTLYAGLSWNGKRIMYPKTFYCDGYVANKALLTEVGWDPEKPPATWDDYRQLGALAAEKSYFLTAETTVSICYTFTDWVWQAGGKELSDDGNTSLIDGDAGKAACAFEAEMFLKGWVPIEGAVGSEEEATSSSDYFLQGRQVISSAMTAGSYVMAKRQAPDMEMVLCPALKNTLQVKPGWADCWSIFRKSDPSAAVWLSWMARPENAGFYCSATGYTPPGEKAKNYWVTDPAQLAFMDANSPYTQMNQDSFAWYQLRKLTYAPYRQAAALGKMTADQAMTEAAKDLNAKIKEQLAAA